jgi:hypothetical protein
LLAGDAQQITDWESFNETLSTFRQYVNIVELDNELQTDQIDEIIDSTWDELTTKGHDLLDKAVADCKKSPNLADAKKLVNRLIDGLRFGLPFSQKFAEKFNQKYGADALKNIKTKLDKCNLGYKAYWEDQGAEWSGVVCSLDQPFTINVVSSGGDLVMPFKFSPTTDQVGTVSFDVTKYDTHWEGNGPYAVKGTDPEKLSLVGTIVGSYTTKSGNGFYPVHFDIPLTPLDTKECSQP